MYISFGMQQLHISFFFLSFFQLQKKKMIKNDGGRKNSFNCFMCPEDVFRAFQYAFLLNEQMHPLDIFKLKKIRNSNNNNLNPFISLFVRLASMNFGKFKSFFLRNGRKIFFLLQYNNWMKVKYHESLKPLHSEMTF